MIKCFDKMVKFGVAAVVSGVAMFAACTTEPSPIPPTPVPANTPIPVVATTEPTQTPSPIPPTPVPANTPIPVVATTEPTQTPSPIPPTPVPDNTPIPVVATTEPTQTPSPIPPTPVPANTPIPVVATTEPAQTPSLNADFWNGLVVADEDRCSPYDPDDYSYSGTVEGSIVAGMGGVVYSPYTGKYFSSMGETDIEHIVARSESHDSGLCASDHATRKRFASDLLNLTLASPNLNRHQKVAKDASEWMPDLNQCWFADRVVQVRQKYQLTVDQREADALEAVLSGCSSFEMIVAPDDVQEPPTPNPASDVDALSMWDDNGNGRITCAEARNHGIAPVRREHPAYEYMTDRDDDGIVCE